jgi:YidC/Oxa1 family membrane protein insertase
MFLDANIFQPLITIFEAVLKFFHGLGVPWGWSIVLLTCVIRAAMLPLTVKQYHSMQRLQTLQPQMKEIQRKYKDDKERMNQEMMKFYRENKVNPLGSCLPLVAQLPVFISLYYMLRTSLRGDICPQLQPGAHMVNGHWVGISTSHTHACGPHGGASFLFISDLTSKPMGAALVALIILYVGTQVLSTLMMSSPTMDKTQRNLMLFMPLIFVFIMISLPAGVMIYWITTNIWTIGQQYVIRRRLGPMGPAVTATAGGSDGGGGADRNGGGGGSPKRDGDGSNGAGIGAGLGGLLRGRSKAEEPEKVGAGKGSRTAAPPPPPRKKKKRSGRRR